jgi:hypothetical protein
MMEYNSKILNMNTFLTSFYTHGVSVRETKFSGLNLLGV